MADRAGRQVFVALLGAALLLRVLGLGWSPGINGDEAWYGAQAQDFVAGRGISLVTPTNNLQNPFFVLPTILVALLPPSFVLLRSTALVAGLLLVLAAHRFLPGALSLGRGERAAATLLVAALPVNVAYSRFAWDTCETALASLLALACALGMRWSGLAVAFLAAVWVHPTNVFLALPIGFSALGAVASAAPAGTRVREILRAAAAGAVAVAASSLFLLPRGAGLDASSVAANLVSLDGWAHFVREYGRLFSGVTVYRYVVGEPPAWAIGVHDAAFLVVVAASLAIGLPSLVRGRDWRGLGLVAGCLAGAAAFHVALGAMPLEPGKERYSMGLVMPGLLAFVVLARRAPAFPAVAGTLSAAMLASFVLFYTAPLLTQGSSTHRTFRSAREEPKAAALRIILEQGPPGEPVRVYAEDWWLHWPMRYLASRDERVSFEYDPRGNLDQDKVRRLAADGAWVVGFEDGPIHRSLAAVFPDGPPWEAVVADLQGRPLVHVWRRAQR